ncbi:HNH endonuclease signature motif containing protein [Mycobacterium bourgelatii]|uniref:HNH nuclease domain-containing protein n=1 Tax=Mycobacterium bourgelatii TaxID=1273442 RepID=A0A7I9YYI7_MYCBU|nr:HNH endonuclease signature motif containing protein [Mycobacterium bourgelatii]GFG93577.1 hypothetical protein MBOU_56190 [Mycobacterium bourgelatii]
MSSSSQGAFAAAYDALHEAVSAVLELCPEMLSGRESLQYLEALITEVRRLPVARHALIHHLQTQTSEEELGGKLARVLANRVRITRGEANRWIGEAADLGPRRAINGEPLEPLLPATAEAQRQGRLDESHVRIIRKFFAHLPTGVDLDTCAKADRDLSKLGGDYRPDQLEKLAQKTMDAINPDGDYTEEQDRARKRCIIIGKQGPDKMSPISGYLSPEARATFETVLAKLAAPGMCNAAEKKPCVDGTPSQEAITADTRSPGQRNHDGLLAGLRALLASGDLGQHNGLPATIIITTTLQELEAAAGTGLTGGGTLLPMSDVIRLARHSHHYLAVFDNGKAIALHHSKRLASPGQRIVLYGKEHGCSAPGCEVSGYYCEVHHVTAWAQCHTTEVNNLTFACGPDHRLLDKGWTTRKNTTNDTEWIPPPHLDHGQPRTNTFHHPQKLLRNGDDDEIP